MTTPSTPFARRMEQAGPERPADGSKARPVIGITANHTADGSTLADGYCRQVVAAGGTPLLLPPTDDVSCLDAMLRRIDALLLSGGADINPLLIGEEPSPKLGSICAERDMPELLLTRMAYDRQLPVLGICRGIQTMAAALGGTVEQHIETSLKHSQQADRATATHSVSISPGSLLHRLYHTDRLYVNSFHHQAVSAGGPHLVVSATAPDGIVEAIESSEGKPLLGVQWHPECMGSDGLPLFTWLVDSARRYRDLQRLHDHLLTLDTHCDTPMLFPHGIDIGQRNARSLVDLVKMDEGRLDATIMVAYLPQPTPQPRAYADAIFDEIERQVGLYADRVALARTPHELLDNKRQGKKSIMLGIENALALDGKIANVGHFARRGVVYITLCHNGDNDVCDSARGSHTHGGLSPFGLDVVSEMNTHGLLVDLSHAAEESFFDALECSRSPIVCSHSSCRALCDHPRNLTDEQMQRLAQAGGVMQVTLYPGFLSLKPGATIDDAMRHIDHAVSVMGVEHVGLGTDFDGDGGVPGLANASELTNYTRKLLARRYNADDIQRLWGGNFLRIMEEAQRQAAAHTS